MTISSSTHKLAEKNFNTAKEMYEGAMLAAKFRIIPIGIASRSVKRRPRVSAHRPHAYDDIITPVNVVNTYYCLVSIPIQKIPKTTCSKLNDP